jgi:hypothetical protein
MTVGYFDLIRDWTEFWHRHIPVDNHAGVHKLQPTEQPPKRYLLHFCYKWKWFVAQFQRISKRRS